MDIRTTHNKKQYKAALDAGHVAFAREAGLGRESLYKALSGEGNPSLATILKVTAALGIQLHAQPSQARSAP
jgi:probable addiction module antidote protein